MAGGRRKKPVGCWRAEQDGEHTAGERHFITTNVLHSAVRYRIDPAEQLAGLQPDRRSGLELVGIYHSHPNGPDGLATDIAEAYYPEAVYLIWCGQERVRGTCAGLCHPGGTDVRP